MSWTLEAEINQLASEASIEQSARALSLISADDILARLMIVQDWYPSGAETYILRFATVTASGRRDDYIMKACVVYSGQSLQEVFNEWLARRSTLNDAGISTPRLYATGQALLIEEFIPYELHEAFNFAENRAVLLHAVARTAATISNMGFLPVGVHDWRSRGHDVVLIDFGADLGPSRPQSQPSRDLLSEVLKYLSQKQVAFQQSELSLIQSLYHGLIRGS